MKNLIRTCMVVLVLVSMESIAQDRQDRNKERRPVKERVDAMKIGFLTERLNLTPEEAQAFWPVYNKYSDELEQLRKNRRENILNAKDNIDEMKDPEIEKIVDNEIIFRQSELEILKKYHPQFKKILPIRKVGKLYRAEEDFKRKLLEMIKERKEERMNRPGPPPGGR